MSLKKFYEGIGKFHAKSQYYNTFLCQKPKTRDTQKLNKAHLLTEDEPSFGAFISVKRFLIITSSPAQAAAALTSSSERPFNHKTIINDKYMISKRSYKCYIRKHLKPKLQK